MREVSTLVQSVRAHGFPSRVRPLVTIMLTIDQGTNHNEVEFFLALCAVLVAAVAADPDAPAGQKQRRLRACFLADSVLCVCPSCVFPSCCRLPSSRGAAAQHPVQARQLCRASVRALFAVNTAERRKLY